MKVSNKYIKELLGKSYTAFNGSLMDIDDVDLLESIIKKLQETNDRRTDVYVMRVHSRFNKVRAHEEREMLKKGVWYS